MSATAADEIRITEYDLGSIDIAQRPPHPLQPKEPATVGLTSFDRLAPLQVELCTELVVL